MALSTFIKEFFGTVKLLGQDTNGVDRYIQTETDGKLIGVNYGNDPDGNREPFSLNADHVLKVDVVKGTAVQVDPVVLTNVAATVYNPGSTASEIYEVYYKIVSYSSSQINISCGIDLGGGTTYDRYDLNAVTLPSLESTWWRYLGRISGDDDVVAHASAATSATIYFEVNQLA